MIESQLPQREEHDTAARIIAYRWRGMRVAELWHTEQSALNGVDVVRRRAQSAPAPNSRCMPFLTIRNDLTVDAADVYARFHKSVRYKIRRCEARDGLDVAHWDDPTAEVVAEFVRFCHAFSRQKRLPPLNEAHLRAYLEADRLHISRVSRDDTALVWHAYVVGSSWVSLLTSASHYRLAADPEFRNLIGRGNRLLHWSDMQHFQRAGTNLYDWGGFYRGQTDADLLRINDFKRGFGGEIVTTYDCLDALTRRGRAFLGLRDVVRRPG
jgi:Acetyltransferase (GNAT) domain